MMSARPITVGAASSGYYHAEGYYKPESKEADAAATWVGDGARKSGLEGPIDQELFSRILLGDAPSGEKMKPVMRGGEDVRRAGLDTTFSAPKTVSIMGLVVGDDRVINAHDKAVIAVSDIIQDRFLHARVWNGKGIEKQKGDAIGGIFRHDMSRLLDPQLHSHVAWANMIKTKDGVWRSLNNEDVYKNSKYLTQVYRSELASNLREIGYQVSVDKKSGIVEIEGVTQEASNLFSKRREQALASVEKRGLDPTPANLQKAVLATRGGKISSVNREEVYSEWAKDLGKVLFDKLRNLETQSRNRDLSVEPLKEDSDRIKAALNFAISDLSERSTVFDRSKLATVAISHDTTIRASDLEREIDKRVSEHTLYQHKTGNQEFITTKGSAQAELSLLDQLSQNIDGKGLSRRWIDHLLFKPPIDQAVQKNLSTTSLTQGQISAVNHIVSGTDKFLAVEGAAGTGKTTALGFLHSEIRKYGYQVEALAPTLVAKGELDAAGIKSDTVKKYNQIHEVAEQKRDGKIKFGDKSRHILIVDESSMLSTKEISRVLNNALKDGFAKVVFVGDTKQIDAVESGTPFRSMIEAGLKTVRMTDIIRQNLETDRKAVKAFAEGDRASGVEGFRSRIIQGKIAPTLSLNYINARNEGQDPAVIVPTNRLRVEVNNLIHQGLVDTGMLSKQSIVAGILSRDNSMSKERAADVGYWSLNSVVTFARNDRLTGVTLNVPYQVTSIDLDKNQVSLSALNQARRGSENKVYTFNPAHNRSLMETATFFIQDTREFRQGENVVFTITDKKNSITNRQDGVITQIDPKRNKVSVFTEGENKSISMTSLAGRGLEYGYARTVHSFQGATRDQVLVGMEHNGELIHGKTFYVAASRFKDDIQIFTEDPDKLAQRIISTSGDQKSAEDIIREIAIEHEKAKQQLREDHTNLVSQDKDQAESHKDIKKPGFDKEDSNRQNPESQQGPIEKSDRLEPVNSKTDQSYDGIERLRDRFEETRKELEAPRDIEKER